MIDNKANSNFELALLFCYHVCKTLPKVSFY